MKKFLAFLLIISTLCVVLCSCGTIEVENVTLSSSSIELEPGNTFTLIARIYPENATDSSIKWTSSNYMVANVVDGTVYAISDGTAIIVATSSNGHSFRCNVTVKTPTAYSKLNDTEMDFFDKFKTHISAFKNPASVSIVYAKKDPDYSTMYIAEIKAQNGFGGNSISDYSFGSFGIYEYSGYIYSSDAEIDVSKINAAIKEYVAEKGW